MCYLEITRVSSFILIFSLGLAACNFPGNRTDASPTATQSVDPCATMLSLALDIGGASSAPALVGSQDAPTLSVLGAQGAQALADQLQPQGTFCDADLPAAFQLILEQAKQLADQGDKRGGRKLLESLLEMGALPHGSGLLSVRPQTPQQARSHIAGYLAAAGLDQFMGGDGQAFFDQANATFSELANSELGSASFDETLRLLDEAQRLGQDDIAQRALKRAQDIAAEGLAAAIEDLDPCLANPTDLHDEITRLLLAFQTASLLGVPDTNGPGGARYDATWSRATVALKALGGIVPDECICDHFTLIFNEELHQQAPQVTNNIFIKGPVEVTVDLSKHPPTLEGEATLPVTGSGTIGDCPAQDSGSDQITIGGTISAGEGNEPPMLHMSITHTMQLQMHACGGGGGTGSPIPLEAGEIDMPFRDGETAGGPMSMPTVNAITTYTLEVACGQ